VPSGPPILLDGAHNPHGMAATVTALREDFAFRHLVAVVAILSDKDAPAMLGLLEPVVTRIVVTENSSPRAIPVNDLAQLATGIFGADRVTVAQTMPDAIEEAVENADGGVIITRSVVTVADARRILRAETLFAA
jgi:dihydrofolate synthase/folylpolyglutamate synthase